MRLEVNGAAREFDDGTTVATLIEVIAGSTRGSAVAVDGEVVPRSQWPNYALRPGHSVEIITAVQGG